MDIWDSLRLAIRHWRFTAPVALAGVLAAALLFVSTATAWTVQTTVVLVGPAELTRVIDGVPVNVAQNSYFEAGVAMPLTRVLTFALRDPSRARQLETEGLSSDFKMTWDNRQPLITTNLSADSADAAAATGNRLIEFLSDELATRQEDVDAPVAERATVEILSISDPKEDFQTARLILGVSALMAMIATVLTAFAVERWRRRGEASPIRKEEKFANSKRYQPHETDSDDEHDDHALPDDDRDNKEDAGDDDRDLETVARNGPRKSRWAGQRSRTSLPIST